MKIVFVLLVALLGITNSCNEECDQKTVDGAVIEYVDFFKSLDKKERNFIVKIYIDSSNSSYKAFRIAASPQLLDKDEVPNKFSVIKEMKVAFFTEMMNENQIKKIESDLLKKGFYSKDSVEYNSNYPEWVLLYNQEKDCSDLVKNTHYMDLEEIIANLENVSK